MNAAGPLSHSPRQGAAESLVEAAIEPAMEELVARCRAGDAPAWKALHDAHFEFVYRVVRRLGTPPEELDDACQDVFIVAFRRISSFRDGRISTWLYRIAANISSERHRRRRVRRAFQELWRGKEEATSPLSPDRALQAKDAERVVGRILERMSAKKREAFVLSVIEELSSEEISRLTGDKAETIRTRLFYARKDFDRIAAELGLLQEGRAR